MMTTMMMVAAMAMVMMIIVVVLVTIMVMMMTTMHTSACTVWQAAATLHGVRVTLRWWTGSIGTSRTSRPCNSTMLVCLCEDHGAAGDRSRPRCSFIVTVVSFAFISQLSYVSPLPHVASFTLFHEFKSLASACACVRASTMWGQPFPQGAKAYLEGLLPFVNSTSRPTNALLDLSYPSTCVVA